ncbi:uncharacterized protein L969DRAFT_85539 [Mixia osmundae IAM 14324]|uniref:AMP-dependent synthetase/ligase domain-containing protein n=1 Tax=Mixia osmundae (strain CBS 9802 / IAM 14324 / JCM 22182 / KY 12970) TaxID=764103 RepID=G7DTV6_MIXOS|nr:uncharacterized protein L969DRAFT_85539 [Mixia osmundae IAM 14324]KEI41730.1 hypothetical protein L969DRAFT_85539 [Mixia osmundae IAM 14324]GAA94016.1 hypothetical protein E5Q_00663 [Mixia osmundae IAM 14324]
MKSRIGLIQRVAKHAAHSAHRQAVVDVQRGLTKTYKDLLDDSVLLARRMQSKHGHGGLAEARVISLLSPGYPWVITALATYLAGGVHVPLLHTNPAAEWAYNVKDTGASMICLDGQDGDQVEKASKLISEHDVEAGQLFKINEAGPSDDLPELTDVAPDARAFILYTSGTTGKPKGVVFSHEQIASHLEAMEEAWQWSSKDKILHCLPLHHAHGIENALLTALWAGATVEIMPRFDPQAILDRWQDQRRDLTLFMAVPTIYSRLLQTAAKATDQQRKDLRAACDQFRLQISGSAPLPTTTKQRWKEFSGCTLLERYGMSETSMILSCGIDIATRIDGHVGHPMPRQQVRLWNEDQQQDVTDRLDTPGEIQIAGASVFKEYWQRPEATAKEFTSDGWFKTGDLAQRSSQFDGSYRILGRNSTDIIKSGGEKISALEVERALLDLKYVKDAAVVAVPDDKWGEVVGAVLVLTASSQSIDIKSLRQDLRQTLAAYKLPQRIKIYDEIPRNAMGKVQKKPLSRTAFPPSSQTAKL